MRRRFDGEDWRFSVKKNIKTIIIKRNLFISLLFSLILEDYVGAAHRGRPEREPLPTGRQAQWGSPTKFSFPPLRKGGMRRFGISKMLSINFFHAIVYFFPKSSIKTHEFFCLGGDSGAPSGGSTYFSLQEGEAEPLLQSPDQVPGIAIGHAHLVGGLMEGLRFVNSS